MSQTPGPKWELRHMADGAWRNMKGPHGEVLFGISGKSAGGGGQIGADFIRMMPGSHFPIHVHKGDHEIFFISGAGFVHVDGEDIEIKAGHAFHVSAKFPHAVSVPPHAQVPLVFFAVGSPHFEVTSPERMEV